MKRMALLVALGVSGVLAVALSESVPGGLLRPAPTPLLHSSSLHHCGCSAKTCSLPCSTCCSPGTCSMTNDPTAH